MKTYDVLLDLNDLLQVITGLLKFPRPLVCRHFAALDILAVLQKNGVRLPDGLLDAVAKSSEGDEEALQIIEKWTT